MFSSTESMETPEPRRKLPHTAQWTRKNWIIHLPAFVSIVIDWFAVRGLKKLALHRGNQAEVSALLGRKPDYLA